MILDIERGAGLTVAETDKEGPRLCDGARLSRPRSRMGFPPCRSAKGGRSRPVHTFTLAGQSACWWTVCGADTTRTELIAQRARNTVNKEFVKWLVPLRSKLQDDLLLLRDTLKRLPRLEEQTPEIKDGVLAPRRWVLAVASSVPRGCVNRP